MLFYVWDLCCNPSWTPTGAIISKLFLCACECLPLVRFLHMRPETQSEKSRLRCFFPPFFHSPSLRVVLPLVPPLPCLVGSETWKINKTVMLVWSALTARATIWDGGWEDFVYRWWRVWSHCSRQAHAPSSSTFLVQLPHFSTLFILARCLCFASSLALTPSFLSPLGTIFSKIYYTLNTPLLFFLNLVPVWEGSNSRLTTRREQIPCAKMPNL